MTTTPDDLGRRPAAPNLHIDSTTTVRRPPLARCPDPRRTVVNHSAHSPTQPGPVPPEVPVTPTRTRHIPHLAMVGEPPPLAARLAERVSGFTLLLITADVFAAVMSSWITDLPWFSIVALSVLLIVCRTSARLYRRRLRLSYLEEFPRSLGSVVAVLGLSLGLYMLVAKAGPADRDALAAVAVFLVLSELLRAMVFGVSKMARARMGLGDRTLVVGTDDVAVDLLRTMQEHPEFGLRPVGFVDLVPSTTATRPLPAGVFTTDLDRTIAEQRIGTVVISSPAVSPRLSFEAVVAANRRGCTILVFPRMHQLYQDGTDVERLRGYPLVRMPRNPTSRPTWLIKRAFDIVFAVLALVVLLPLLAICALAILIESGRPILFSQERVGLDGRSFQIFKLRSLKPVDEEESQTRWSVSGDSRVGPVGRMLRRTSLDELPQLWNIVKGEMSVVGPRPERPGFVAEFIEVHDGYWARHRVPAGLTGLAQVTGLRGDTSIVDRARYDNYYIANWSLWLDLTIILRTVRELARRGQY